MKLKISNCNNITEGEVEINEGCLNIKYGVNGTGKSTISKAIEAFVNNDDNLKKELVPYYNIGDDSAPLPNVTGVESINSVAVFNEEYIARHIFKEDELIEDSFSIFVKTPKYDEHMKEIERLLKEVSTAFMSHPELNELIDAFSQFVSGFGKSETLASNSVISKAISKGNKLKHIPSGLEKFSTYLKCSEGGKNVSWLKWQLTGKEFLEMEEQCPYCSGNISTTKDTILKITEEYKAKDIEHLNTVLVLLEKLIPYFSDSTAIKIREIRDNVSSISSQQKEYLVRVKDQVRDLLNNLLILRSINYNSLKSVDKIADELSGFLIDLSYFPFLFSDKTAEKINIINNSLKSVLALASKLQDEVFYQNCLITRTIEKNKTAINEFLRGAGYNYVVDIVEEVNRNYRMILKPQNADFELDSVNRHLSYGEKNALALALFAFTVQKEKPDLIILDDPISSFDGNKKFALINLLFLSKNSLKNRTVLLLTHEFNTIIDIMKVKKSDFSPAPKASFLTTKGAGLTEKEIRTENICTIQKIAKDNLELEIDNIIKSIYLRRLFEVEDEKDLVWQMTSSLLHKDAYPRIENDLENRKMTDKEFESAEKLVCKSIPGFDYFAEYKKVMDLKFLLALYESAPSNFEKLQIYRIIHNDKSTNAVVKKFVNETYHVGNDYVWQLNPREFDTIPQFVVDECDREIALISI